MSVVDYREGLRGDLDKGVFPRKLEAVLALYRKNRTDPYWRSSAVNEALMEVAMYVQDKMSQAQT